MPEFWWSHHKEIKQFLTYKLQTLNENVKATLQRHRKQARSGGEFNHERQLPFDFLPSQFLNLTRPTALVRGQKTEFREVKTRKCNRKLLEVRSSHRLIVVCPSFWTTEAWSEPYFEVCAQEGRSCCTSAGTAHRRGDKKDQPHPIWRPLSLKERAMLPWDHINMVFLLRSALCL